MTVKENQKYFCKTTIGYAEKCRPLAANEGLFIERIIVGGKWTTLKHINDMSFRRNLIGFMLMRKLNEAR